MSTHIELAHDMIVPMLTHNINTYKSPFGWWQFKDFSCSTLFGEKNPHCDSNFSDGLKPPTSHDMNPY